MSNIDFSKLIKIKRDENRTTSLLIRINASGFLSISGKLRTKLKSDFVDIFIQPDYSQIYLKDLDGEIKLPKGGVIRVTNLTRKIASKNVNFPLRYSISFDKENDIWAGELLKNPLLQKKKKVSENA